MITVFCNKFVVSIFKYVCHWLIVYRSLWLIHFLVTIRILTYYLHILHCMYQSFPNVKFYRLIDWPLSVWESVTFSIILYLWDLFVLIFSYRGRLIFTPAQNHQIVEKTRFFDVISTNMIRYGFLLVFGTVPIRNRTVNDERNHRVSYLPKYRQKRWIFNEFRLKNWLHRTRADTESQVLW